MSAAPETQEEEPPLAVPWTFSDHGPDDETIAALAAHRGMIFLPSPADVARYLEDLTAAVGGDLAGYGAPDSSTAAPVPVGVTGPDGRRLIYVFTHSDIAREFAVTSGLIAPTDAVTYLTRPWTGGLRHLLASDAAGMIVDDGTPARVQCDRTRMAALLAGLDRDRLARERTIHVVVSDGSSFVERAPDGRLHGFVYDGEDSAAEISRRMREHGSKLAVEPRGTQAVLLELFEAGVTRLEVNRWLSDARDYDRHGLERLLRSARDVEAASAAHAVDTPAPDPALPALPAPGGGRARRDEPTLLAKAHAQRPLPPVPSRHVDDAAATAFFRQWRKKLVAKEVAAWQFVEAMTHEGTLWVPRASAPVHGLAWPVHVPFDNNDTGETFSAVPLYTSEAAARRGLASAPGTASRFDKLSAIEAFRWIWASPLRVDQVLIDYGDEEHWLAFPLAWIRDALYPICHDVGDLASVPRVAPGRLGRLPGVHQLRPEVVRAFVAGWKTLVEPPAGTDGRPVTIEHEGRRLIPVFSDAEGFFSFQSARTGSSFTPAGGGGMPPFRRWLTAGPDIDGILLDPGTRWPLVVDAVAIEIVDRCVESGRYPLGADLIDGIAPLALAGALSKPSLARILAEIPVYWFDACPRRAGGFDLVHAPGDADTAVLFTSEERARRYLNANADGIALQAMQQTGAGAPMTAYAWPQQWATSPWVLMADNFESIVVDPAPDGSGGVRACGDVVRLVLDRLSERTRPRVADFVCG